MSEARPSSPPPLAAVQPAEAPGGADRPLSTEKVLRRLFLMLFLRGRSARGLRKENAPRSIGRKLVLTLIFYALFGLLALSLIRQPVFTVAVYLHAMTFVFLGMFVAASAGEILFNDEEADILLHRPVSARELLWAKIRVLVEVSLWLAGAFNLAGFIVGMAAPDGSWLFPLVHAVSTTLEALFCTGCVIVLYQLCLRWFGRERLDGLMTTAQVLVSTTAILGGQMLPRLMLRANGVQISSAERWWIALLPPAWFAGFDDLLAGHATASAGILAGCAVLGTGLVLALAFGRLARDYGAGLQRLGEHGTSKAGRGGRRRWIDVLVGVPPLCWWLRDPMSRASFVLIAAYLARDRDVKLRLYPGIAPALILPIIFLFEGTRGPGFGAGGFGVAFTGTYLAVLPLVALNILQYSVQYQASDVFRAAPVAGPAFLYHGARRAVLLLLTLPAVGLVAGGVMLLHGHAGQLLLLLPGLVTIPVYSLIPGLTGAVPLSRPTEEAKSAGRGLFMIGAMMFTMLLGAVAAWAWSSGWFGWFLLVETAVAVGLYVGLRMGVAAVGWPSME